MAGLFDLLDEFFTKVGKHDQGRRDIRREHRLWLQSQSWYSLELERFGSDPAGDLLDVNEAAMLLGVSPQDVREMAYEGELRAAIEGPDVRFRADVIRRTLAREQ